MSIESELSWEQASLSARPAVGQMLPLEGQGVGCPWEQGSWPPVKTVMVFSVGEEKGSSHLSGCFWARSPFPNTVWSHVSKS